MRLKGSDGGEGVTTCALFLVSDFCSGMKFVPMNATFVIFDVVRSFIYVFVDRVIVFQGRRFELQIGVMRIDWFSNGRVDCGVIICGCFAVITGC